MLLNKKRIKIISFTLIFITIFTFSVVLATDDDTIYVWSSESQPISTETSTTNVVTGEREANVISNNNITNELKENETEDNSTSGSFESETTSTTETTNSLNLQSGGAVLIEQRTGQILYNHNMHEQLRPASVTKVMSLLLIMEALDSGQIALTDTVPCTEDAAGMGGSQIWLEVGEELTVDEMLKAICVVSANDCTEQFRHL